MTGTDALVAFLQDRLAGAQDVRVTSLSRSGGGSSKENFAFDATWMVEGEAVHRPLLLRRDPGSGVVETGQAAEFALLQALAPTPVPSPVVHWIDEDGTFFGRPATVVERSPGRADRAALKPADPLRLGEAGRLRLARDLVDVLAHVHAVDVAPGLLPDPGPEPARHELERWERELDAQELEPQPALRHVVRWLRDRLPPPPDAPRLVHGDFRPANVLVHDGRLSVLLDWELAHLGDPVDDLGWYCCSIYAGEHFPAGWTQADLLDAYEARTGTRVDPEHLRFWAVMSSFRVAVIALTGVRLLVEGRTTRPAAPVDRLVARVLADTA